ncbi:DEAD/DEAH box helicase [Pectobacterium versatile]|uniref:DEAD/DEAH box helicase n=1 Tax=Pectobacterium versatile TaxID=2488639 RepID=UPI003814DC9A
MSLEIVIIYDEWRKDKNIRIELQYKRLSNRVGPFIRNLNDDITLEKTVLSEHRSILFVLRYFSNPLQFPIRIKELDSAFFISDALQAGVKFYSKKSESSSIKKNTVNNDHLRKFIFSKLLKFKIFVYFFDDVFYITPFFQDSNIESIIPLHTSLFLDDEFFDKYVPSECLKRLAKNNIDSIFWMIGVNDLIKLQNESKSSSVEYIFYTKKENAKKIKSQKNSYGIEWFDSKPDDILISLKNNIIEAYILDKKFEELTQIIDVLDLDKKRDSLTLENKLDSHFQNKIRPDYVSLDIYDIEVKLKSFGFTGILKPYQEKGIIWLLNHLYNRDHGVLLSDDMGLGKTLQTLSFLACIYRPEGEYLVICPASLKYNWLSEINKFYPSLEANVSFEPVEHEKNIHIVSYEQAKKIKNNDLYFDVLILDESQKVKNKNTKAWVNINSINSGYRILLTGTPVENSENDLINTMSFIYGGQLPSSWSLLEKNKNYLSLLHEEKVTLIKCFFNDVILSRKKEDYLDLPPYSREVFYIDMEPKMKDSYDYIYSLFRSALSVSSEQYGIIFLDALLKLRQVCSLPSILRRILPNELSFFECDKFKITKKRLKYNADKKLKTIFFCTFLNVLDAFENFLNDISVGCVRISGDVSNKDRDIRVRKFQEDDFCMVFLSTMHVGGVGLNLTEASEVIIYNNWWNPAVELQAISRAHRLGQKNKITVFLPIYKNSVEEKIELLLEKKRKLHEAFTDQLTVHDYKFLLGGEDEA